MRGCPETPDQAPDKWLLGNVFTAVRTGACKIGPDGLGPNGGGR